MKTIGFITGMVVAVMVMGQTTRPVQWQAKPNAPEPIKQWLADQAKYKANRIKTLDDQIKSKEEQVAWYSPGSVSADPAELRRVRFEITELRSKRAKEVRDTDTLFVPSLEAKMGSYGSAKSFKAIQVFDGNSVLVEHEQASLLLVGIDTKSIADGQPVPVSGNFMIRRTQQYETVLGAKATVLVIERCRHEDWIEMAPKE